MTRNDLYKMLNDNSARPINGYHNYYITKNGDVITENYRYSNRPNILRPAKQRSGYLHVVLCKNGVKFHHRIHRLVAEAFIPNKEKHSDVNHIDEDKSNNHVSNLEWLSHKDNMNYGSVQKKRAEKRSKKVAQIDLNGGIVKVWKSTREAERNGFVQSSISACARGLMNDHKGYRWEYI